MHHDSPDERSIEAPAMMEAIALPVPFRSIRRFFRTPKGILILVFAALMAIAVPVAGTSTVLPGVLGATAAAVIVDVGIVWVMKGGWSFPSGALLTGLIIAMVLSPIEPFYVPIFTSILAIVSKHLFRTRLANVFNPAALGIVVASVIFSGGQSWWGALPTLGVVAVVVLVAAGLFVGDRINKLPLILMFLGCYFGMFTIASVFGDPTRIAEIFRTPDLQAVLFFAFFMVDDPPTCPVKYRDQLIFAMIVATASYAVFMFFGVVYYLPAGLLIANGWEAWRRSTSVSSRATATA